MSARVRPCFGEDVLVLEVTSKDLGTAWQKLLDEQDARMLLSAHVTVNDDDGYVVTGYLHR